MKDIEQVNCKASIIHVKCFIRDRMIIIENAKC